MDRKTRTSARFSQPDSHLDFQPSEFDIADYSPSESDCDRDSPRGSPRGLHRDLQPDVQPSEFDIADYSPSESDCDRDSPRDYDPDLPSVLLRDFTFDTQPDFQHSEFDVANYSPSDSDPDTGSFRAPPQSMSRDPPPYSPNEQHQSVSSDPPPYSHCLRNRYVPRASRLAVSNGPDRKTNSGPARVVCLNGGNAPQIAASKTNSRYESSRVHDNKTTVAHKQSPASEVNMQNLVFDDYKANRFKVPVSSINTNGIVMFTGTPIIRKSAHKKR